MTFKTTQEIFTTEDAAEYLDLKPDTVRKYVQRGLLTYWKTIGQAYLFTQAELDRFNDNRRGPGNPAFQR